MYCVSFKQALAVIPFAIDIELIYKSSCCHPFNELPFFYYKGVIAAIHSIKFTVFLQNRNCSNEILTLSATIHYNKRSVVDSRKSWRVCLFQENHCGPALLKVSIFSTKLVAMFFLKSTVLNAQKHLQRSHSFMVN